MNRRHIGGRSTPKLIVSTAALLAFAIFLSSRLVGAQDSSSPDEQSSGTVLYGSVSNDASSGGAGDVFNSNGNSGGDEFSSNGGGGDEFSSNAGGDSGSGGGGDVFGSNGGGDTPYAYPTPPPRFPCGPNAIENQAWGGAFASGFLDMLKPLVTQACVRAYAPRRRRPSGPPVFVFYYINGMNTPVSKIYDPTDPRYAGNWRGSCITEHDTFALNILGIRVPPRQRPSQRTPLFGAPQVVDSVEFAHAGTDPVEVGNEIDVMFPRTCNVSGKDPWGGDWYTLNCIKNPNQAWMAQWLCDRLKGPNVFRAGDFFAGSISPTDLLECVRQSTMNVDFPFFQRGIDYTTNQDVVNTIVNSIRSIYSQELKSGSTQRHYFIVTGHSQGNFFAEGVAYKLYASDNILDQQIFKNRLGIISLGSPTSYTTLPPDWVADRVKHRTRKDDGINLLLLANALVKSEGKASLYKVPWPPARDDLSLWNWSVDPARDFFSLDSRLIPGWINTAAKAAALSQQAWALSHGRPPESYDSLVNQIRAAYLLVFDFSLMGAGPPKGASEWSSQNLNGELYTPLLNSHLVDNYLTNPTASEPGVPISAQLYKYLHFTTSPPAPTLQATIRSDVIELKRSLLRQSGLLQARNP